MAKKKKVSAKRKAAPVNAVPVAAAPAAGSTIKVIAIVASVVVILLVLGVFIYSSLAPVAKESKARVGAEPATGNASASSATKSSTTTCTADYQPVCGSDGNTYSNSCYAKRANVNVASQGKCTTTTTSKYKPATVQKPSDDDLADMPECIDGDEGKDKYTPAEVWVKEEGQMVKAGEDGCAHQETVLEYYCEDGVVKTEEMPCLGGLCVDARCVPAECHDPDGMDIMTATVVSKAHMMHPDGCDKGDVLEGFCDESGELGWATIPCPEDHACEDGACHPVGAAPPEPSECVDSDNGLNYAYKGTADDGVNQLTDNCMSNSVLIEYWCDSGNVQSSQHDCGAGAECKDGACVIASSPPSTQTCSDSDGGQVFGTKGLVTITYSVGGSGLYNDYCDTTDNNKLVEYYCDGDKQKSISTACPAGQYCDDGACGAEPACNDPDGNDLTQKTTVTKGIQSQEDYCQWNQERTVYEAVCSSNKITVNAQSCPSGKWCQLGACVTEPACTETDSGQDYSTRGTTTKGTQSNSDYCMGNDLKEFYCDSTGLFKEEFYTCLSGCSAGKCD